MLIALNDRIGVQTVMMANESEGWSLFVLSPMFGEIYLGTEDHGDCHPLSPLVSWLVVSALWFTPWRLCQWSGKRFPWGTRLMYSRGTFKGYAIDALGDEYGTTIEDVNRFLTQLSELGQPK